MFALDPKRTFRASVAIPPSGDPLVVEFRHKTRSQLADFVTRAREMTDLQVVSEIVESLPEQIDGARATLNDTLYELLEAYPGAGRAIFRTYLAELTGAARGNS